MAMGTIKPRYFLFLIITVFLAVELAHLDRTGAGYDEIDDLNIAKSYVAKPLAGSSWDPTQARLPMYAAHLFALLAGHTLRAARFVSILFGVLGLCATYLCAKRLGGPGAGILACLLLAMNPLYLEYARHACTESGVQEAALGMALCFAVVRLTRLSVSGLAWVGIAAGLVVSAKLTGVVQIPLALTALLWLDRKEWTGPETRVSPARKTALFLPALPVLLYVLQLPAASKFVAPGLRFAAAPLYLCSLFVYGAALLLLLRYRKSGLSLWFSLYAVVILCAATALLIPPPHFCNPEIFSSFIQRITRSLSIPPWPYKLQFLSLCFLFKQSPFLGFLNLFCLIGALWLVRRNLRLCVLLASLGLWVFAIARTDMLQVFYLLPLLPCASAVTAVVLRTVYKKRPVLTCCVASVSLIGTMADISTAYPDFNLLPYRWLNKSVLLEGYPPIGCTMMTDVGFDGMEQSLKYVNERATGKETVVSYFRYEAEHIYRYAVPVRKFTLVNGTKAQNRFAYKTADYVISTIEVETLHELGAAHPELRDETIFFYDPAELEKNFTKVFTVDRAYGLAIACVWKRKL